MEKIPDEVRLTETGRPPTEDPLLGRAVAPALDEAPIHPLVTIGDSVSHGFQSGAILNTHLSYPAILARTLGLTPAQFRFPRYDTPEGSLPLNIEFLLRHLEKEYGPELNWYEIPGAALKITQFLERVEDYWERGDGSQVPDLGGIPHNLGIYGWGLRDALSRNAAFERAAINAKPPNDDFLPSLADHANSRAALRVLAPAEKGAGDSVTPLEAAIALGEQGGIGTLVVELGANNVLGVAVRLEVKWSGDGFDDPTKLGQYTVWRPSHFQQELNLVVDQVRKVRARTVIWCTVPHITIVPLARGVGKKIRDGSRYFPHYTYVFIKDDQFNPKVDPNFTAEEARAVDSAIDQYNEGIIKVVDQGRQQGLDWRLMDLAGLLDNLAHRRYHEMPADLRPPWFKPYPLPAPIDQLAPKPNTLFFRSSAKGRTHGGLFSLDGVHPTTIGYGIIAQEMLNVMWPANPPQVDFARLAGEDSLISNPPKSVHSNLELLGKGHDKLDWVLRVANMLRFS
jgi:hypothetical protein